MSSPRTGALLDLGMTLLCLGAAAGFLAAFDADIREGSSRPGEEPVGSVVYTRRTAQRRDPVRTLWQALEPRSPVYALDAVRTDEGSEALIALEGGAEIGLGENSLVVLAFEGRERSLSFVRGSLIARSRAGGASGLTVRSARASFEIEGGGLDLRGSAEEGLSAAVEAGRVLLSLESGEASLLEPGAAARIEEGEARTFAPALSPLTPGQGSLVASFAPGSPLEFAWLGREDELILELSPREDFGSLEASHRVGGGRALLKLPPGTWWWRLRPASGGEPSRALSFTLLEEAPLRALRPEPGARFALEPGGPGPLLSWAGAEAAQEYRWELAAEAEFRSPLAAGQTKASSILLEPLPPGAYFWRVRALYPGLPLGSPVSEPASFTLEAPPPGPAPAAPRPLPSSPEPAPPAQATLPGPALPPAPQEKPAAAAVPAAAARAPAAPASAPTAPGPAPRSRSAPALAAPRILEPASGSAIDMSGADSLLFRWEAVPGARAYRLSLLPAGGGEALWIGEGVQGLEYRFERLELLDVGSFLLRIEALGAEAGSGGPGLPAESRFSLSLVAPGEGPSLLSPSTIYVR